jgi:hypothetical protein
MPYDGLDSQDRYGQKINPAFKWAFTAIEIPKEVHATQNRGNYDGPIVPVITQPGDEQTEGQNTKTQQHPWDG